MDDTFTFVKKNEVQSVKNIINRFHGDIQFTHEVDSDGCIAFLGVSVKINLDGSFETSVYRKKTDTNMYVNW